MKLRNIMSMAAGLAVVACGKESIEEFKQVNPSDAPSTKADTPEEQSEPVSDILTDIVLPERPNILLIMCDDLGYSDLGCYGSEIHTPNIDALASRGVRFRSFYNMARSSPTRASLLTGLYPHQVGFGALSAVAGYPCYAYNLNQKCNFIPEVLSQKDYYSFITGKWHLNPNKSKAVNRGFDRALYFGGGWYWSDDSDAQSSEKVFFDANTISVNDKRLPGGGSTWYASDMWVDMGMEFVQEAIDQDRPFFWYLAFNAPHFPIQSKPETIEKYVGTYKDGYTEVRKRRFERQVAMGLFKEGELTPENPHPNYTHWEDMGAAARTKADRRMSVYAACIEEVDTNIGRAIQFLHEKGLLDNTLIFFLSDNGGNAESGWPGAYNAGPQYAGGPGSNVWLGAPWAGVANTPYLLYKHHGHNGGCCTPFIMSWPAAIPDEMWGTIDLENYGHVTDVMPTILEITGAEYPSVHKGNPVPPTKGKSLVPAMFGRIISRENPIIVEHEGNKMLREGDWKIVQENENASDLVNPWRMYNLREDPTEMHDLSKEYPLKLQTMLATYTNWADYIGVAPELKWGTGLWYSPVRDFFTENDD